MGNRHVEVRPLAGAMGAELVGVDLSENVSDEVFEEIHQAFLDHGMVCFRDQQLSEERQIELARRFGEPEVHPIVDGAEGFPELVRVPKPAGQSASFGVGWHTDNSFFECPSLGSVLYGIVIPPYGGDTLYASMEKAYADVSDTFRKALDGLQGVHSASRAYDPALTGEEKYRGEAPIRYRYSDAIQQEVEHPVVRTHPETGRKSLYVNPMFTLRIAGMKEAESAALLAFLFEHCARPEFSCRLRWQPGTVAIWDNRCVWHYAMDDYQEFERLMHRVTVAGDRPR